jgi:hypothetical protein
VGLEQVEDALARLQPADEQHAWHAVLPAGDGHGPGEARDIHAVRDHLVVAGEEAVDEMASRGADRDPSMQPRGVPAHQPAAQLVRRRKAGVGVERGDVDAARFAQQEERQERHERLVEVEQVEALAGQQVAHLAEISRREGQRPHRAVGRHGEPHADPQDVALRCALWSMAGGDDPHVVSPESQVLVEEPDVLGDPTGFGVDVRADQADLHGWPPRSGS